MRAVYLVWLVSCAPKGAPPVSAGSVTPSVRCADGQCTVRWADRSLAELWWYGTPEDLVQPVPGASGVWLVREHAGDGCPVQLRFLCTEAGAVLTDPFGNCEDPAWVGAEHGRVGAHFQRSELGDLVRPELRVAFDARTCTPTTSPSP